MADENDQFYYIFDAEGTLFFTDALNNESYNYALAKNLLHPIYDEGRITRKLIIEKYPYLDQCKLNLIIKQKQAYFLNNIDKVQKNDFLFDILKRIDKERCVLWTASDSKKMESIINNLQINKFFYKIIFAHKKDIAADINRLCLELECNYNKLLIFENDLFIARELKKARANCLLFMAA